MLKKEERQGFLGSKLLFYRDLREIYGEPPFSVLDTRQGAWISRRRKWLALGIKSEIGRGLNLGNWSYTSLKAMGRVENLSKEEWKILIDKNKTKGYGQCLNTGIGEKYGRKPITGTSIFDPVICELMYTWFCPKKGKVLDPFAGGSVRGIVAGFLGFEYVGFDIRKEQIGANAEQFCEIKEETKENILEPKWICDDSRNMVSYFKAGEIFDFIFSCPPYGNLETYGDDIRDLSNCETYNDFIDEYAKIIILAGKYLKENRFACFVVTNFRDKKTGFYNDFVGDTVEVFKEAGLKFYNEIILVNSISSLPIRVKAQFEKTKKVGKTHQNILVFYKGADQEKIREIFGFHTTIPDDDDGEINK